MVYVSYLTLQCTLAFRAAMGVCCHTQGNLEDTLKHSARQRVSNVQHPEGPVLMNP